MINKNKPYIASVQTLADDSELNYKMKKLNQIHFAFLDHKDNYYKLEDTKRYLDIKVVYNRYTYKIDDKTGNYKETKNTTIARLKDCNQQDFNNTEDEKKYWKLTVVR